MTKINADVINQACTQHNKIQTQMDLLNARLDDPTNQDIWTLHLQARELVKLARGLRDILASAMIKTS